MENLLIPDSQKLINPFLETIRDERTYSLEQITEMLRVHFNLTMEDMKVKKVLGGQPFFRSEISLTCKYLLQRGLITGVLKDSFQITDAGKRFLLVDKINNLDDNIIQKTENISSVKTQKKQENIVEQAIELSNSPEVLMEKADVELHQILKKELLALIEQKSLVFFEHFIFELLRKLDYKSFDNHRTTTKSQDNLGIEGVFYKDELLLDTIYIQAKKWFVEVNSKDIRNFTSAMLYKGTNRGVFITTSYFSDEAKSQALQNTSHSIVLIDADRLMQLAIKHNVGIKTKKIIEVKEIDHNLDKNLDNSLV